MRCEMRDESVMMGSELIFFHLLSLIVNIMDLTT